ncbi:MULTISPECIES: oxygen-independent coproporphyrinogen III oxidase [Caulobacter]|jgi:oxygen-independent coproporphyrinogen-3 oxidase|uniref:Coproporphyrinogen-III oxidase n=1 Tax=Caulobacter vibrioides OR37 TaxID=1292034 RepID=R0EL15_CAUVI|nr:MULTISPECIES: oxygen-independent coproporphyrinogen III oxidase [Caulobacter]ENZ82619.1 oxygen-independent coproporphyrinogen III oxidase [Caulobacter vibrioides OR37]
MTAQPVVSRHDLLTRYDSRAPRYTSYPTALQFSNAVDADVYGDWLSALDPAEPVSLYAHIPFCDRLCWYCGCNTRVVNKPALISDYVDHLIDELILVEKRLPGRIKAGAVHLGGGTPNMLSRDDLVRLFGAMRHVFPFAPGVEISAELDPAVLTEGWVKAAAFHGLNRASLGVQDLAPHVQEAVNRIEPFDVVARAVHWLRQAEVASINLDLMYGLPRQTTADVVATLDKVLALRPERIALFGYAHVPWARPHQKLILDEDLADAAGRLEQSQAAAERLVRAGYVAIGLDHFALPSDSLALGLASGTLRRNFQGYTTDPHPTLIGLGASSIGRLPQGYAQNQSSEVMWRAAIASGRLPVARGVALTDDDRLRADVIERLMCDFAVDLGVVAARHGVSAGVFVDDIAKLESLRADGLARVDGDVIRLTEEGRPFVRLVAQAFDRRSEPQERFSRAI